MSGSSKPRSLSRRVRRAAPAAIGVVALISGFTALSFGLSPQDDNAASQASVDRSAEATANRGSQRTDVQPIAAVDTTSTTELTTTTTAAPTTTTEAPTTTTAAPTTTTTAAPEVQAAATSGNVQSGVASYYDYKPGGCAHKTLPKGTVVTVTNLDNGKSTTCTVNDRGPYVSGRIIDLETRVFKQVSSTSAGVFNARISW